MRFPGCRCPSLALGLEPSAVVAGTTVVVPGFAPRGSAAAVAASAAALEPLAAAVAGAVAVSAEVVHRGWRNLPAGWGSRAAAAERQLRAVGLADAAGGVDELVAATRAAPGPRSLDRWADAHLRLLVTAEQL